MSPASPKSPAIAVKQTAGGNPLAFEVVISGGAGQSRHAVMMTPATYQRLSTGRKHSPAACIEAAFRSLWTGAEGGHPRPST